MVDSKALRQINLALNTARRANSVYVGLRERRLSVDWQYKGAPFSPLVCIVVGIGSEEQMSRIDACGNVASVQCVNSSRYLSVMENVGPTVSANSLTEMARFPVSITTNWPCPQPTSSFRDGLVGSVESLLRGFRDARTCFQVVAQLVGARTFGMRQGPSLCAITVLLSGCPAQRISP